MLQLPCPYCGTRDETEFLYGGEAHIERPGPEVKDEAWAAYLFYRRNPQGVHHERWCHTYGCGQWFNVARHTVTHEILSVYRMGKPMPVFDRDARRRRSTSP